MKIVITGAGGLIGWHASARLHAFNSAAMFKSSFQPYEVVRLDHAAYVDDANLQSAVVGADAVLHFAGVNRGLEADVESGNLDIARRLVAACKATGSLPHIIYSNSVHAGSNTPYGRSKRIAGDTLGALGGCFTDLVLPHIFGECARPRYNNVTASFIQSVIAGDDPEVNHDGCIALLHAGAAAQVALDAAFNGQSGTIRPDGRQTTVPELLYLLKKIHADYSANVFPNLSDPFVLSLFNSYRAALYPSGFPRPLKLKTDARGSLFEAVKASAGGQVFLSTTKPGITRGDHFHLHKVERFLVVQGEAIIRIRKVLGNEVWEYRVSGDQPAPIDMPSLHTHSIENVSDTPLLTLFWANDLFDPASPDTYFDPVLRAQA